MSSISKGAKELALKIEREEGGDPRAEEQRKPRGNGIQEGEPDPDRPSLPHGVTTNGFQVLLRLYPAFVYAKPPSS